MIKLLLAFVFACGSLSAVDWKDHWVNAIEACHEKDYVEAEKYFNLAIAEMELHGDNEHPHVYVDRGRLYFMLENDNACLADMNKAIANSHLQGKDAQRAYVTRMFIYSRLGLDEECLQDMSELKKLAPFPVAEFSNDKIIIRHVPNCECYQKLVSAFLVSTGWCDDEQDIQFLPSGICIARKNECNCGFEGPQATVQGCQKWCDRAAIAGATWCGRVFKSFTCQLACAQAVDLLKDGCYWCCANGSIYRRCIKPFEDIVGAMGNICDPYWD